MKQKAKFLGFLSMVFCMLVCQPVAADSWKVTPGDFQYDMSLYFLPTVEGKPIALSDGYELAAFCGEECRGTGSWEKIDGHDAYYGYMRIRSNQEQGEKISFKLRKKSNSKEWEYSNAITFESNAIAGMPSAPRKLYFGFIPGDVNGDGTITITDAVGIVNFVIGADVSNLNSNAADANGDGSISITDAVYVVNIVIGKNN